MHACNRSFVPFIFIFIYTKQARFAIYLSIYLSIYRRKKKKEKKKKPFISHLYVISELHSILSFN